MKNSKYNMVMSISDDLNAIVNGFSGEVVFFYKNEWNKIKDAIANEDFSEIDPGIIETLCEKSILVKDTSGIEEVRTDHLNEDYSFQICIYVSPKEEVNQKFFVDPTYSLHGSEDLLKILEDLASKNEQMSVTIYGADCFTKELSTFTVNLLTLLNREKIPYIILTTGQYIDLYEDFLDKDLATLHLRLIPDDHFYQDKELSFERIWSNYLSYVAKGIKVGLFIPFDEDRLSALPAYYQKIHQNSLVFMGNLSFNLEPVDDIEEIKMNQVCHQNIHYFNSFLQTIKDHPQLEFFNLIARGSESIFYQLYRSRQKLQTDNVYCEAYNDLLIFDLYGNVYKCLQSTIDPNNRVGTYGSEVDIKDHLLNKWTGYSFESCADCVCEWICSGGCNYSKDKLQCDWERVFENGFKILLDEFLEY